MWKNWKINKIFATLSFILVKAFQSSAVRHEWYIKIVTSIQSLYYTLINQNIGAREVLKCCFSCIFLRYWVIFLYSSRSITESTVWRFNKSSILQTVSEVGIPLDHGYHHFYIVLTNWVTSCLIFLPVFSLCRKSVVFCHCFAFSKRGFVKRK